MYSDLSLKEFTDQLAAGTPVPGGGGAAALAGALGAALVSMVSNLTVGRPRFRDVEAEIARALAASEEVRARLLALVDEDARAYGAVSAAYRLPRGTLEERTAREAAIQAAFRGAMEPLFRIAEACVETLQLARVVAEKGNPGIVSDTAVGAQLALAALRGVAVTLQSNFGVIKDASAVQEASQTIGRLVAEAEAVEGEMSTIVEQKLRGRS
ncbi:MAG: cyclodeaminase/cyclohydrolase family protein [Chloroflexi bacterium]|nr:cyclodeaminase/cyclohydrolase family protein [Chloroflexota bacterium]